MKYKEKLKFIVYIEQVLQHLLVFLLLTLNRVPAGKLARRFHSRIHWRLLTILQTSSESVWSNVFWCVKVCVFWNCIQYTIHSDKTKILKKFPLDKINGTKNTRFYLLLLLYDSYMSWRFFFSLKLCVGFSSSVSVYSLNFIFLFKTYMDPLTLKRHNSFEN